MKVNKLPHLSSRVTCKFGKVMEIDLSAVIFSDRSYWMDLVVVLNGNSQAA